MANINIAVSNLDRLGTLGFIVLRVPLDVVLLFVLLKSFFHLTVGDEGWTGDRWMMGRSHNGSGSVWACNNMGPGLLIFKQFGV